MRSKTPESDFKIRKQSIYQICYTQQSQSPQRAERLHTNNDNLFTTAQKNKLLRLRELHNLQQRRQVRTSFEDYIQFNQQAQVLNLIQAQQINRSRLLNVSGRGSLLRKCHVVPVKKNFAITPNFRQKKKDSWREMTYGWNVPAESISIVN
ncbi:hypothetical protein pb186bvf_013688 [Paramecium bursaria]